MNRLKRWLMEQFFPAEAKQTITRLQREILEKDAEIASLHAYIDGLEYGMRCQRRIVINNTTQRGDRT